MDAQWDHGTEILGTPYLTGVFVVFVAAISAAAKKRRADARKVLRPLLTARVRPNRSRERATGPGTSYRSGDEPSI